MGFSWYDLAASCERVGDLHLGLPEDDARLLLARGLGLAGHRVLQRGRDHDVAHLHGLDGDAPGVRSRVDQLLELVLDLLPAAKQVREGRPADDVPQRRLRRPAHGLLILLHLEGRLLRVVDHPEEHRVHVDGHRVGGEGLLGREVGGDRPLVDPGRPTSMNGTTQKRPGPRRPTNRPRRRTTARSHCCAIRGDCMTTAPRTTHATRAYGLPADGQAGEAHPQEDEEERCGEDVHPGGVFETAGKKDTVKLLPFEGPSGPRSHRLP